MIERLVANIGLAHGGHGNGGQDARRNVLALERGLKREPVHDRGKHAHVVGPRPIHPAFRRHQAAIDVAGADNEANLRTGRGRRGDVPRERGKHVEIDAVTLAAGKRLARKLQQHPAIAKVLGRSRPCHQPSSRLFARARLAIAHPYAASSPARSIPSPSAKRWKPVILIGAPAAFWASATAFATLVSGTCTKACASRTASS